jgi:hypothetical protein
MKLPLRAAAFCLTAVLTLGMMQPATAFATGDLPDTEESVSEEQEEPEEEPEEILETNLDEPSELDQAEISAPEEETTPDPEESTDQEEEAAPDSEEALEPVSEATADVPMMISDVEPNEEMSVMSVGEPVAISEDEIAVQSADEPVVISDDEDDEDGSTLTLINQVDDEPEGGTNDFSFTIYVWNTDASGESRALVGTYGDVTFQQYNSSTEVQASELVQLPAGYYGKATVTISSNETKVITGLPENYGYCITQNYRVSMSNISSNDTMYYLKNITVSTGHENVLYSTAYTAGATGSNTVRFNFEYAPGYLRVGTEVQSTNQASADDEFEFTIYLYKSGASANTPFFDEDEKEVSITFNGTEDGDMPNLGNTLTFNKTDSITLDGLGKTGVYNMAKVTLKSEESVVLKGLGTGYGYYIVETKNIHYMVASYNTLVVLSSGSKSHRHYMTPDCSYEDQYIYLNSVLDGCAFGSSIDFINSQESLTITKQVKNSDTKRDFVFNVFFAVINPDTGQFKPLTDGYYQLNYSNGNTGTVYIQQQSGLSHANYTFQDWYGKTGNCGYSAAQIRLKAGESVTIEGLPMGVTYDVVEVPVENYTISATAVNGTVGSNGNVYSPDFIYSDASATFTNTFTPAAGLDLTLSKTVSGNMVDETDMSKVFTFDITLTDADKKPLSNRDIAVQLPDGTETVRTTDSSGTLTVQLKHGQSAVIKDLPAGTNYTVKEEEDEATNVYTTTFTVTGGSVNEPVDRSVSGALDAGKDVTVQVNNENSFVVVPTGVETENAPYLLLLTGSAAALLLLLASRRRQKRR